MKTLFDNNPLKEFNDALEKEIKTLLNKNYKDEYESINSLIKVILMNNGCGFADESYGKSVFIMDNSYGIYFIIGGTGNKVNEFFDFINLNGMNYFVIFLDVFKDIMNKNKFNEIAEIAAEILGNSNYFYTITKLVNIFITTIANQATFTSTLSTTAMASNYRFAPYIIAGSIIYNIVGELNENDVSGIDYNDLTEIINSGKIDLALYGILRQ